MEGWWVVDNGEGGGGGRTHLMYILLDVEVLMDGIMEYRGGGNRKSNTVNNIKEHSR